MSLLIRGLYVVFIADVSFFHRSFSYTHCLYIVYPPSLYIYILSFTCYYMLLDCLGLCYIYTFMKYVHSPFLLLLCYVHTVILSLLS